MAAVVTRDLRRVIHLLWCGACLATLAVLVGVRWLRYASWSTVGPVDRVVGELMIIDAQAFLWPWGYTRAQQGTILLAGLVAIAGLHRRFPEHCVYRNDGVWRATPTAIGLLLALMVWFHYLFDLNPTIGGGCLVSLALVTAVSSPRFAVLQRTWLVRGAAMLLLGCWLWIARDPVDRLTIVAWVAVLATTQRYLTSRIGGTEVALLRGLAIMPMNLLPAMLPLFVPLHGGTHLGDGLAYGFCESPDHQRLYATIPVCDSVHTDYDDCRDGHIVEYDLRTLTPSATHRFFSPQFYGRFEMPVCMGDEVQVAVQGTVFEGKPVRQTVLSFPVAAPSRFNPVFATGIGVAIAYDPQDDASFYSAEFDHQVARYDRRTRKSDVAGEALRREWFEPVSLERFTGSASLYTDSVDVGRNRIYLVEWLQGRNAYALDLTTLEVLDRYEIGGGGGLGITVDAERQRLIVSSLWGLDVFDVASGRRITSKRLGLGNRRVIVDAPRNRLYLSSTVEGKIRILDRETYDVVGQIPIGIGTRYAHLSADGRYLFASSAAAHYYWDVDTLVSRH